MNIELRLKSLLSGITVDKGSQNHPSFTPVSLYYIKSIQNPGFAFTNYKTPVPIKFCDTDFLENADSFKFKNGEPVYDVKSHDGYNNCRIALYKKNIVNIYTTIQVHFYEEQLCFSRVDFAINHPEDVEMIKAQIARKYRVAPENYLKRFIISDSQNNKIFLQLGGEASMIYISGSSFFQGIVKRFIKEEYIPGQILQHVKVQQALS